MICTDIIDRLDTLIIRGLPLSEMKPHFIDARDQAAALDKTLAELKARNESLVISLETAELRNAALLAAHLELQQEHAKFKEAQSDADKKRWNEFAEKSNPPDTYTDDGF